MQIKELAKAVGIPAQTIRYYERTGLMPEARRSENNYRVYTHADEDRLRFIRNCRVLDMSLDEVRELIHFIDQAQHPSDKSAEHDDCSGVRSVVAEHLEHVRSRLKSLKMLEKQLTHLLKACDHPEPATTCGMIQELFSNMEEFNLTQVGHGVHT